MLRTTEFWQFSGGVAIEAPCTLPSGAVLDANIPIGADIDPDKFINRYKFTYYQANGSSVTAATVPVAITNGACVVSVAAALITPNVGAATVTVDLRVNGSTILNAVITFDNGDAAYAILTPPSGYTSQNVLTDKVLSIVTTATAGGGTLGQGLIVSVWVDETL